MIAPLIDAAGVRHRPASAGAARIVSLVPSLTELLFDLGLEDQVVGRTAFCVHPEGRVKAAKSIGGTKTINVRKLHELEPTHVLVNIDETPRALAEELAAAGYTIVVTHPVEIRDNLALYKLLGGIFGRQKEAMSLCRRFEAAYDAARLSGAQLSERRVLYLIWKDPWMTVTRETYVSRMLASVGLHTLPAIADRRYPIVKLTEDVLHTVDLVLFSSEPFPFRERHLAEFRVGHPAHASKATTIDAEMVSWYGSRAILGLAYLAEFERAHA